MAHLDILKTVTRIRRCLTLSPVSEMQIEKREHCWRTFHNYIYTSAGLSQNQSLERSSLVATTNLKSHGEGRDVVLDKVGRGNFSLHVKSIHAWGRTAELDTVRPAAGACVEMMLLTSVVLLSRYALTFRNCSLWATVSLWCVSCLFNACHVCSTSPFSIRTVDSIKEYLVEKHIHSTSYAA